MLHRPMGANSQVPATTVSLFNTFGVLATVAFYDLALVPLLARYDRAITTTTRIGIGFVVEIVAILIAGAIETARGRLVAESGLREAWEAAVAADPDGANYLEAQFKQPMSIWWQAIPYFLLGLVLLFLLCVLLFCVSCEQQHHHPPPKKARPSRSPSLAPWSSSTPR